MPSWVDHQFEPSSLLALPWINEKILTFDRENGSPTHASAFSGSFRWLPKGEEILGVMNDPNKNPAAESREVPGVGSLNLLRWHCYLSSPGTVGRVARVVPNDDHTCPVGEDFI